MAIEAYIVSEAAYRDAKLDETLVLTLYEPDADARAGALTTQNPLTAGERGGPLVVTGRRDSKLWKITLPEIEVKNRTAVGFEYVIHGPIERTMLGEAEDARAKKKEMRLENLGATF